MKKSKRKIALLTGTLGLTTVGISAVSMATIPEENEKFFKNFSDVINTPHITTSENKINCQAKVHATNAHELRVGTSFETVNSKPIQIEQKMKKIYLINNTTDYNINNFFQEIKQTPAGASNSYISGQSDISKRIDLERNDRIYNNCPNWLTPYLQNIKIDDSASEVNWGVSANHFTLPMKKVWDKDKDWNNIQGHIIYGDNTYDSSKDLPFAAYTSSYALMNNIEDIYSMDTSFFKEVYSCTISHSSVSYYYNRYFYTMFPDTFLKAPPFETDTAVSDTKTLTHGRFTLDNLISIEQCSYDDKTMKIGIDHHLLEITQKINEEHEKTKKAISEYQMQVGDETFQANYKMGIQYYLERNQIDLTNLDFIMNDCAQVISQLDIDTKNLHLYDTLDHLLVDHETDLQRWVASQGLNEYDNPQLIFDDLSEQLIIDIRYATSNAFKPDSYDNKILTTTLGDLIKEDTIVPLFVNTKGEYQFQLQSIRSHEVNNYDTYIQSGNTSKLKINDSNVSLDEKTNTYQIDTPKITEAIFKDDSLINKSHLYPCQLTDEQVFNMFITLIDSYKNIGNFSMLNTNQYQIERDEFKGTIDIDLFFNDEIVHHQINGFKCASENFLNIDGSKYQYDLIANDLNNNIIKQILIFNDIDPYLVEICNFKILANDNENGKSEITIENVANKKYESELINKIFVINKLQNYYIKQANDIPLSLLKLKPSDIKMSDFKQKFIVMSDEFFNRHNDDLQIKLTPNNANKFLHAHITYSDNGVVKEIDFEYYGFNSSISKTSIILFFILGVTGLIAIVILGYFLYKKVLKKHFARKIK